MSDELKSARISEKQLTHSNNCLDSGMKVKNHFWQVSPPPSTKNFPFIYSPTPPVSTDSRFEVVSSNRMKITVWGCRGSICVSGPTTRSYGGNTTCLEIRMSSGRLIIVDAGSGMRLLGKKIMRGDFTQDIVFVLTHAHRDHLIGFPFFAPAYHKNFSITLCGGATSTHRIKDHLRHEMEEPYFPINIDIMKAELRSGCCCSEAGCDGSMNGLLDQNQCHSIPLNHPNGGYGFKFTDNGKTFIFLPDNELRHLHAGGMSREHYVNFCKGADLLFHDAQYTDKEYAKTRGWGHSTYEDAVQLAIDADVKSLGLFHHDPDRSDDEIDQQVGACRKMIGQSGAKIDCFAVTENMIIDL